MSINLSKGQKVNLSKDHPELKVALVGLGWDIKQYDSGADYDLDASIFLLDSGGKCAHESDFIFYNNLSAGGVTHSGDNRTGEGDGDDEAVTIEFDKVPAYVEKIAVTVTIYDAVARGQNRHNGEWKFSAVGSGFNGGLEALCRQYGLSV